MTSWHRVQRLCHTGHVRTARRAGEGEGPNEQAKGNFGAEGSFESNAK